VRFDWRVRCRRETSRRENDQKHECGETYNSPAAFIFFA
jgi:hypothetical protein